MKFWLLFASVFYLCLFSNSEVEDEFTFGGAAEEEEEDPEIKFNLDNDTVVKSEMQFIYARCNATKFKPNTYKTRWLDKSGTVVSPNEILYFKSLLKSREGTYMCEIEKEDKKYNKTFDLQVTIPSISIEVLSDESLRIGGKIKRKCSDLGLVDSTVVDTFTYQWVNEKNVPVSTSNILEIPIHDSSVSGTYECRYKSKETEKVYTARTTANIIQEIRPVNYKIQITTSPGEIRYSKPFSMSCDVTPPGGFSYRWFKDDVPISTNQTILFQSFNKDNVGTYKCIATVGLKTGDITLEAESSQQFTVFTHSKVELTDKPGPNIFVHTGEKKELHCEIDVEAGKRGLDVEWYINGKLFKRGDINNVGRLDKELVSMLVIRNIVLGNEGNYECRVGNARKEANIIVMLQKGIIETNPPLLRVKEGQSVEFHCRVDNIPNVKNVNLKWRFQSKDGRITYPIPNSRWNLNNPEIAEETSFIDLQYAQMDDNGYLICSEPNGQTAKSELIVIPSDREIITITPKEIRVRPFQKFEIECFTKNREGRSAGRPRFMLPDGKEMGRDSGFAITNVGPSHIRLTAPNGLPLSNDKMQVDCGSGDQRVSSRIYIKDACPQGNRYCKSGQCLENAKFCDGKPDCDDKSDEDPNLCQSCDPISKKCEINKGEKPTKQYYLVHWACDGENDCGNNYDEDNCGDWFLEYCGGKFYTCPEGKRIPRGYICDQNTDCDKGDDENLCTYPQIIKSSNSNVKAAKNQQVTMSCEATGKPLPAIIWRFNWGCIKRDSRFLVKTYSSNCTTVSSTLTINDFQPGDDGIYNCEALSSRQRAFSNDFLVVLENKSP